MMNNLSWFLYAADVLPGLAWVGIPAILIALAVGLGGSVVCLVALDSGRKPEDVKPYAKLIWLKAIPTLVIIWLVTSLIPSKETIYLIAGSEAGETVVTSEEGQEILSDIHEVIKYQLGQLKGEEQ